MAGDPELHRDRFIEIELGAIILILLASFIQNNFLGYEEEAE